MEQKLNSFERDVKWVEPFAQLYGAKIENNFIILPSNPNGIRYFLDCGNGVVAYYINYESKKDLHLFQSKINKEFVGIYYNLTDGDCVLSNGKSVYDIGHLKYNLCVVDCSLDASFYIPAGNKIQALCIFVEKNVVREVLYKNSIVHLNKEIIGVTLNKIPILLNRMSNESYHLLSDLARVETGSFIFDLNFRATVHLLLSNYLKKIENKRLTIDNIKENDLEKIISLQMYLLNKIEEPFPTITEMTQLVEMSESKLLASFRKVNGTSPSKYFLTNKMLRAKQLLEEKELSILEISNQLSFANSSHFSLKFKQQFKMLPNEFVKQL